MENKWKYEQEKVNSFYKRIEELKEQATNKLKELKKNDNELTDTAKTEMDSYVNLYSDKIQIYNSVTNKLCFGKLETEKKENIFIGKIGISNDKHEQLLVDWRAPIAEAFYRATANNKMGILKRSNIILEGQKIIQIFTDDFKNNLNEPEEKSDALDYAISKKRTGQMHEIVATIQKEQDEIIRHQTEGVFVVNGAPGTGKTVVALHRAAYMLYTLREKLSKNGILILGPSDVFGKYISSVLPSLGENNSRITTVSNLLLNISPKYSDDYAPSVLKGQLKMKDVLKKAVDLRIRIIPKDERIRFDSGYVVLKQTDIFKVQKELKKSNRKYNENRVLFLEKMIHVLTSQYFKNKHLMINDNEIEDSKNAEIMYAIETIKSNDRIIRLLNLCWMPLEPKNVLNDLITKKEYLINSGKEILSEEEIELLYNPKKNFDEFSESDIALLDELDDILGREPKNNVKSNESEIQYIKDTLASYGRKNIWTFEDLYNRYEGNYIESMEKDNSLTKFGHIIIDEAQDISPMEWRMISRRSANKSMTIVGDLAQSHFDFNNENWSDYLENLLNAKITVKDLKINYRTPKEIMEYAQLFGNKNGLNVTEVKSVKNVKNSISKVELNSLDFAVSKIIDNIDSNGKNAIIIKGNELQDKVKNMLLEKSQNVKTVRDGENSLVSEVLILDAKQSKGLEFDNVFVINPKEHKPSDLYVSFTRATNKLFIIDVK